MIVGKVKTSTFANGESATAGMLVLVDCCHYSWQAATDSLLVVLCDDQTGSIRWLLSTLVQTGECDERRVRCPSRGGR